MLRLHFINPVFLHFEKVLFTFFNRLPKNREDTFETNCNLRHYIKFYMKLDLSSMQFKNKNDYFLQ